MQYELLTQKLNKMDKEKILLDALNTFGNFTSVGQEFNANQLEVIYEAMNQVLHIAPVAGRSEQFGDVQKSDDAPNNDKPDWNGNCWNQI
jgi:hypothetical protein